MYKRIVISIIFLMSVSLLFACATSKPRGYYGGETQTSITTQPPAAPAGQREELTAVPPAPPPQAQTGVVPLPPAEPGQCFAEVFVPPKFKTVEEEVLQSPRGKRVEVTPPRYEWTEEKVMVKEPSTVIEVVPAEYKTVEEKVVAKEASYEMKEIPAKYKTVDERVLVKPAEVIWEKTADGKNLCLKQQPAAYKAIQKKVLVEPARTERVEIPPVYETVKKTVLVKPETTRTVEIPAEYETRRVLKIVAPPEQKTEEIPAQYVKVSRTAKISDASMKWVRVLCEANLTPEKTKELQESLKQRGYYGGEVNGENSDQLKAAVQAFQRDNNLEEANGAFTIQTVEKLGCKMD